MSAPQKELGAAPGIRSLVSVNLSSSGLAHGTGGCGGDCTDRPAGGMASWRGCSSRPAAQDGPQVSRAWALPQRGVAHPAQPLLVSQARYSIGYSQIGQGRRQRSGLWGKSGGKPSQGPHGAARV